MDKFVLAAAAAALYAATARRTQSAERVVSTPWATTWLLDSERSYGSFTVVGPLALSSSVRRTDAFAQCTLVANGVNIPTLDGVAATEYGYRNVAGLSQALLCAVVGGTIYWSVLGTDGRVSDAPAAPVAVAAPTITQAVVGLPLVFTPASFTGSPAPTIAYTVMDGNTVLANNVASGQYTPTTAGAVLTVRAVGTNASGSAQTTSGQATVGAAVSVPGAPTGLTVTAVTSSTVSLQWTAPTSNGGSQLTDYVVQRRPASGGTFVDAEAALSTSTSAVVTGLSPLTATEFRVLAVNVAGRSPASGAVTGTTVAASVARLSSLVNMSEVGDGPYGYVTGAGATSTNTSAGDSNISLPASASGSLVFGLESVTATFAGAGLKTTNAAGAYNTFTYLMYHESVANLYKVGIGGAAGIVGSGPAANTVPQAGDLCRVRRAGSALYFEVARAAAPDAWLIIHSITSGVSQAELFPGVTSSCAGAVVTLLDAPGFA